MKKLAVAISLLLIGPLRYHAQLSMNAGDSFAYHFDGLQYQGTSITFPLGGQFNLLFDTVGFDSGDTLRMELFEGLVEGTPVAEQTITLGTHIPFLLSESAWADLEGGIRITALTGTFTVNQIDIIRKTLVQTGVDLHQLTIIPVPEPSTLALGILGAAAFLYRRRQARGEGSRHGR